MNGFLDFLQAVYSTIGLIVVAVLVLVLATIANVKYRALRLQEQLQGLLDQFLRAAGKDGYAKSEWVNVGEVSLEEFKERNKKFLELLDNCYFEVKRENEQNKNRNAR